MFNVRNFILSTWLRDLQNDSPFCYQDNETFFNKYEPKIKKILDSKNTIVFITHTGEHITPYGGPFNLKKDKPVKGYCIINTAENSLYGLFTSLGLFEHKVVWEKLFKRACTHLKNPKEVYMPLPKKRVWLFLKKITKGKDVNIKIPKTLTSEDFIL